MTTISANPPIEPLQKTIKYMVDYLTSTDERDVSPSGLLNWFTEQPRDGSETVFDEDGKIKDELRNQYKEKFEEIYNNEGDSSFGRAFDGMIMSVSNDLVAQIEAAVAFRTSKIASHFAKSLYNIKQLGTGAVEPKRSESILEEYTTVFMQNAIEAVMAPSEPEDSGEAEE